jgi:hypothetical protein
MIGIPNGLPESIPLTTALFVDALANFGKLSAAEQSAFAESKAGLDAQSLVRALTFLGTCFTASAASIAAALPAQGAPN